MKKFTVSENTEIVLDGKRILLEEGDEIGIDYRSRYGDEVAEWLYRMAEATEEEKQDIVREIREAGLEEQIVAALKDLQRMFVQGETR